MEKFILLSQVSKLTKTFLLDITKLINTSVVKCNTCGSNKMIKYDNLETIFNSCGKEEPEIKLIEGEIYNKTKE
jgi:hypothetical protein